MKRYLDSIFPSTAAAQDPVAPAATPGMAPVAAGRACWECGAAAAPDQDWCLECGSRIEETGAGWHQPVAVMASVALIFVAGLALALSEVAKDADIAGAKTVRKTVAAAPPPTPASPTPDTPTPPKPSKGGADVPSTSKNNTDDNSPSVPSADTGSSPSPDTGSSTGSPQTGGGTLGGSTGSTTPTPQPVSEWPTDSKGYTVVLLSTTTKSEAEALARKAAGKGFDAGILSTDDFNLRPDADAAAADAQSDYSEGLWLVWAGRYKSSNSANQGVDELSAKGLQGDSVEYVTRKKSPTTGTTSTATGTTSTATGTTSTSAPESGP